MGPHQRHAIVGLRCVVDLAVFAGDGVQPEFEFGAAGGGFSGLSTGQDCGAAKRDGGGGGDTAEEAAALFGSKLAGHESLLRIGREADRAAYATC